MIGETGLDSVLPGILLEDDCDMDPDNANNQTSSNEYLHLRIKTEYDLDEDIKTELPDSCSDFHLLVRDNVTYVTIINNFQLQPELYKLEPDHFCCRPTSHVTFLKLNISASRLITHESSV